MKHISILLFSLSFIIACSSNHKEKKTYTDWDIMEKSISENWAKNQLESVLGAQVEALVNPDGSKSWFYYDIKSNVQRWAFRLDNQGYIDSVTFIPTQLMLSDLTKKWEKSGCQIQSFLQKNPHVISQKKYLSCDNGKRRAYFNHFNEVESIVITR